MILFGRWEKFAKVFFLFLWLFGKGGYEEMLCIYRAASQSSLNLQ